MAAAGASGSLESTLDKRLQAVTNTMDSIQGLSMWCIENKKYHSVVVRCWMKWLRKSDASHRLNLLYVANDIIQNCKRKGAVVYRTAFADILPDAFLLISHDNNTKVLKSVERILSIWEDRNVYTDNLITELRGYLVKEESPPAASTPVEQKTPVDSNAALKSKVLAEFVPQALVEQLSSYKNSLDQVDLREKQLAAMRVDVCSTSALRRLKDKAGGKKFSKDFEDGSAKLQDFVKFLDQQSKGGPLLLEALNNADIFYEMQYQEVKIVANAYQTFANRVSHLKRKLDSLKTQLPDLDESPIPSPSADAPSPTGSESPFRGLDTSQPDPDLDGSAMDDSAMDDEAEPPAPSPLSTPGASPIGSPKVSPKMSPIGSPKQVFVVGESDNIEVEDMELSEDEMDSGGIIVEEPVKMPSPEAVSNPVPVLPADTRPSLASEAVPVTKASTSSFPAAPAPAPVPSPARADAPARAPVPSPSPARAPSPSPARAPAPSPAPSPAPAPSPPPAPSPSPTPSPAPARAPASSHSPASGLSAIDLNKMNSLISSLTSALKNTGASVETPSSTQTTQSSSASSLPKDARSLVNMLSKVDMTPADLLNALAKARGQGLTSFFTNTVGAGSSDSSSTGKPPPSLSSTPATAVANIQQQSLASTTPVPPPNISAARHSPLRATPKESAAQAPALHVPAHQTAPQPAAPAPHALDRQPSVPHVPAPQASAHQATPLLTSSAASALPSNAPNPLVPAPQASARQAPVHQVPVPRSPVPHAPVSQAPAHRAPVSQAPAHRAPVSQAPVSHAPVSQAPVSHAPASQVPAHHAPASQVPAHHAPVSQSLVSHAPVPQPLVSHAPVHQGPAPLVPSPQTPAHQTPIPHAPVHQGPAPRAPAPRAVASKAPAPKAAPILTSASALVSALHRDMDLLAEPEPEPEPSESLDSKIHSFLHGNPGFNFSMGFASDEPSLGGSPVIGTDTRDGTPVRDEGGGTPTQDEIMDKPAVDVFESSTKQPSAVDTAAKTMESKPSPSIYQTSSAWQDSANPQQHVHAQPGAAQNGQGYQPFPYAPQEGVEHGKAAPVERYQQIAGQAMGPALGGNTSGNERAVGMGGWYSGRYPDGSGLPPGGGGVATPGGSEHQAPHLYPYQAGQSQEPQGSASHQGAVASSGMFKGILPPLPNMPPHPGGMEAMPTMAGSEMIPPQRQEVPIAEVREDMGVRTDSIIGRMVVHDHQHKSLFHTDDPQHHVDVHRHPDGTPRHPDGNRHPDEIYRHPDGIHRHPGDIQRHPDNVHGPPDIFQPPLDDVRYQEDRRRFHDELRQGDVLLPPNPRRHHEEPFYGPDDPYYGPEPHFGPDPYRRSPSPPLYAHGRMLPPPPHHEMRHPGPWPRHRPPHPPHRPPRGILRGMPRGGPRPLLQPFHGPDPRLQGKRPPRGGGPGGPMFLPKRPYLPPRF